MVLVHPLAHCWWPQLVQLTLVAFVVLIGVTWPLANTDAQANTIAKTLKLIVFIFYVFKVLK